MYPFGLRRVFPGPASFGRGAGNKNESSTVVALPNAPTTNLLVQWRPTSQFVHLTGVGNDRIDLLSNSVSLPYSISQSVVARAPLYMASVPEINNQPAIHFTGGIASPYFLSVGSGTAFIFPPWTIYAVFYPDLALSGSGDASSHLIDGPSLAQRNFYNYQQGTQRIQVGNPNATNAGANTFVSGAWQALCWEIMPNGTGSLFNMTASTSPQTNFVSPFMNSSSFGHNEINGNNVGVRGNGTLGWWGMIADFLIYTGTHSQTQKNEVASYITGRYGISINIG